MASRKKAASKRPEAEGQASDVQSAAEKAALNRFKQRYEERAVAPRIKVVVKNGVADVSLDHTDRATGSVLLAEALGSTDWDFVVGLQRQLVNAAKSGPNVDESEVNFLLSVIKDIKPRDQLEAMLAAQMAVTHEAIMTFARRLANVENIPQQDSAERAFNKLTRTYAMQLEALKRYRSGGEQKVTVQHVNVGEGGQAIVGNVTARPVKTPKGKPPQPRMLTERAEKPMKTPDITSVTQVRKGRNG